MIKVSSFFHLLVASWVFSETAFWLREHSPLVARLKYHMHVSSLFMRKSTTVDTELEKSFMNILALWKAEWHFFCKIFLILLLKTPAKGNISINASRCFIHLYYMLNIHFWCHQLCVNAPCMVCHIQSPPILKIPRRLEGMAERKR